MKPLEVYQRVLTWICGLPPEQTDSKSKKIAYITFTVTVVVGHLMSLVAGAVFIYQNVSIDLEETLFSLFHTLSSISMLYQSLETVLLCTEFAILFEELSKIYRKCENWDSFSILIKINEKCHRIWGIFFKYFVFFLSSTLLNAIVSVVVYYIGNGHFEAEPLYHPFKFILPWNQSTPHGYALEIAFDLYHGWTYMLSNGALLFLFISICLHHKSFYKIFRNEAKKLNYRDRHRNDADHLRKMIEFHILSKHWCLKSVKAYSPIVLIVLVSHMLILSCSVFQLDLQLSNPNFGMIIIIVAIFAGGSCLFTYCYFGKMATESYAKMVKCLYDCNWHELDVKLQKYFVIMIGNAQIPIYYHGFGVAVLNLETFAKVVKTVVSYYMVFKTITSV